MESGFRNSPDDQLLDSLKDIVGSNGWRSEENAARYFEDPRERFQGKGCLILMPGTTAEVAEVVRLCDAAKVGIIPFSGGTGVVAGQISIDSANAIIISLERMNKVRDVSIDDGVIVAEAGCILENIHSVAAQNDLMFPLSMASKGSCCIGGNLATNAGGIQVVRYGNARDLCLGIEAVLPNGDIISELSPLHKNNTGYDLRHLLIGSEGTLGIITAATLVLKPIEPETSTVLCAIKSPTEAMKLHKHLRKGLGDNISALELLSGLGLDLVTTLFPKLSAPFEQDFSWYLLVEASGPVGLSDRVEMLLAESFEDEILLDAVIAQSQHQKNNLWDLRENTPDANRAAGAFCNSDTAVPISKVDVFIAQTEIAIRQIDPTLRVNTYGHIGDGNIHHNVLPPVGVSKVDYVAQNPEMIEAVRMAINETTQQFGGSISAEHGIGRLKIADLNTYVSLTKRNALKRIKAALDPNNIMNPDAVVSF